MSSDNPIEYIQATTFGFLPTSCILSQPMKVAPIRQTRIYLLHIERTTDPEQTMWFSNNVIGPTLRSLIASLNDRCPEPRLPPEDASRCSLNLSSLSHDHKVHTTRIQGVRLVAGVIPSIIRYSYERKQHVKYTP